MVCNIHYIRWLSVGMLLTWNIKITFQDVIHSDHWRTLMMTAGCNSVA